MLLTTSLVAQFCLFATLLAMAWHARYSLRRGRFFMLDPLNAFWGGVLVCYVWQPISNFDVLVSWHSLEVIQKTLLLVLVAVVGLVFGYESRLGVKLTRFIPEMPQQLRDDRVLTAALLLMGLGVVGYSYQAASVGGWSAWLSVGRTATNWDSVSSYVTNLETCLPVGVGLLLFSAEFRPRAITRRLISWSLGGCQWLWFVYLGSRSRTIAFALAMLAAYYLPRRRNPPIVLIPVLFGALAVLVSFEGAFRDRFTNLSIWGNLDYEEVKASAPEWIAAGGSGGASTSPGMEFNCVAAAVELVPDIVDYNYGYSHLELLTRVVPRALWPDKIYPHYQAYTPLYRAGGLGAIPIPTAREYLLMGPSFTFVGHWYSVGGVLALAFASVLTGAAFRAVRGVYDRLPGSEGDIILYASLVPLGFGECAGEPLFFVFGLPFTIVPLIVLLRWCGRSDVAKPG
jgi:hypothetical protein